MSKSTGILLDENGDVAIDVVRDANDLIISDFIIGDITVQNQQLILLAEKGEIKEDPKLGVALTSFIDDDDTSELLREIRLNLTADGQKVEFCGFNSDGKLKLIAGYTE